MCRGGTDLGIIPIFLSPSLKRLERSCRCYFNTIFRLERMGTQFQSCWRPFSSYCLWTLMFMPRYAAFFLWDKTTFDMTNVGDADGSCEQGQEFGDARAPSVGNISGLAGFLWRQKGATSPHQPPFFSTNNMIPRWRWPVWRGLSSTSRPRKLMQLSILARRRSMAT